LEQNSPDKFQLRNKVLDKKLKISCTIILLRK
jgi:hypothetical protein